MAAESNLWSSTQTRLKQAGFFVQRIENLVGDGTPDAWVGGAPLGGGGVWLENKAQRAYPARASSKVFGNDGLRTEQVNWLLNAARLGVPAFVWAGVGAGHKRETYLVPAALAAKFNDWCKADLQPYLCPVDQLIYVLRRSVCNGTRL